MFLGNRQVVAGDVLEMPGMGTVAVVERQGELFYKSEVKYGRYQFFRLVLDAQCRASARLIHAAGT